MNGCVNLGENQSVKKRNLNDSYVKKTADFVLNGQARLFGAWDGNALATAARMGSDSFMVGIGEAERTPKAITPGSGLPRLPADGAGNAQLFSN